MIHNAVHKHCHNTQGEKGGDEEGEMKIMGGLIVSEAFLFVCQNQYKFFSISRMKCLEETAKIEDYGFNISVTFS